MAIFARCFGGEVRATSPGLNVAIECFLVKECAANPLGLFSNLFIEGLKKRLILLLCSIFEILMSDQKDK